MNTKVRDIENRIAMHERLLANPKLFTSAKLNIEDNLKRLKEELKEIKEGINNGRS